MLDEMLDRFNKAIRPSSTFTGKKNLRQILSLNKVASVRPDTLLKETPAQFSTWDFRDTFKNTFYVDLLQLTASIKSSSWNFKNQKIFQGGFYQAYFSTTRSLEISKVAIKSYRCTSKIIFLIKYWRKFIFSRAVGVQR